MGQRGRDTPKGLSHILSVPWECSRKHPEPTRAFAKYSHPKMPKGVQMSLNVTPEQVGKFRYLETLKAQLSPLQEHSWEPLGTAQEGKGF